MDPATLRAWWWTRQGLDGRMHGKPPEQVLEQTGWARSVGGSGPYLTLFARAGTTREQIDTAVSGLRIYELPSARGCTYVLPASDFALGLKVGQNFGDDMKTVRKLGVTDAEIDKLCAAIIHGLQKGPLDTDQIRETAGSAVRSLGPEGAKKGVTTTLPVALGKLQPAGEIRRVPINGRLDQQRYKYALWRPNPLAKFKLSMDEAYTELARRFYGWIGPATLSEFQWFSALGVKAAKAAIEPWKLVPLESGDERLILPQDREEVRSYKPPKDPQYALVSGLDAIFLLRRDLKAHVDAADRNRSVFLEKEFQELGGLKDLPSHAILDRGRLIGLWEFDPQAGKIVWMSFVKRNKELEQAVQRMEEYVQSQLGDARSFSLDSPKSRVPRIEALRKAGAAR